MSKIEKIVGMCKGWGYCYAVYFSISSIFLSLSIFPLASSIRMSLASFKNSEAKMNSLRRLFLLKIILLLPTEFTI